jgi:hypothetical protein
MKKLLPLALAACVSLPNSSCSKKDDPAPNNSQLILGQWYPSTTDITTTSSGQSHTHTMTYDNRDIAEVFTTTKLTIYYKQSSVLLDLPYTTSGNTYTIDNGNGASDKYEIVTLNSSTFVRKLTAINGTSTTVYTMTLVR